MKVVFMGTPDFSVPTLEKLYSDKDIELTYVVTKNDTRSKRGQNINYSEIKKKALELNLNILQPLKIKEDIYVIDKLKECHPDFIVVVAYGQILSKEILDIPKFACINGHASLLPKYRGASPIQSAILNGDTITGTTTMLMDEGLDTGYILEQSKINIDKKETSDSLFEKLSHLTADLVIHTIKNFNIIKRTKQDDSKSTKSKIIKKEFGEIDFNNETTVDVDRKIRAYTSWPSAYFIINNVQYKIFDVDICSDNISLNSAIKFSENIYIIKNEIYAKCKDGFIRINIIQKSGKNKLSAHDFVNGLKLN